MKRIPGHDSAIRSFHATVYVNYRFNIVKYEHGPFDGGVSILLQYPVPSELLPREVLEVSFFSLR